MGIRVNTVGHRHACSQAHRIHCDDEADLGKRCPSTLAIIESSHSWSGGGLS